MTKDIDIVNIINECEKTKQDYLVKLPNGFDMIVSPIVGCMINDKTVLSIYDEGWDIVDNYLITDFLDCIPIIKSNL
jgi:hypothetical protein